MHEPTIVAVGMFDGVHRGHQYVLGRLVSLGRELGLVPTVVTFSNHPRSVTSPGSVPDMLTDASTRASLMGGLGVRDVVVLDFDDELRRMTASEFGERVLKEQLNARALLLGYDNGFGSDGLKGVEEYRGALEPLGISVAGCEVAPSVSVSSTAVRVALSDGDVVLAHELLGRPYSIAGNVVRGKHLGSVIGFPTANLDTGRSLLPGGGVYVGRILSPERFAGRGALINIGTAPTVNGDAGIVLTEVHILVGDGECVGELYGERVGVEFLCRLRDERRFGNIDELREALDADRRRATEILEEFSL